MELISRATLNIMTGSIFAFWISSTCVFLIRPLMKNYRVLSYLYALPFIKVLYDLVKVNHSQWGFLYGQGVLSAEENSRTLSAMVGMHTLPFSSIHLSFYDGKTFSIGDVIADFIPKYFLITVAMVALIITGISLVRYFASLYLSLRWQRTLPLKRMGSNLYITSKSLKSPIIIGFWKSRIIIPLHLFKAYKKQELDAVYQHESAHARWKDNLVALFIEFIKALFWFIPFKNMLYKKSSLYRELSCDIHSEIFSLINALKKTAKSPSQPATLALTSTSRIDYLINKQQPGRIAKVLSLITLMVGGAFIFASHFFPF